MISTVARHEHARDLALGPLLERGVDVGRTRLVRRQSGVGHRLASARPARVVSPAVGSRRVSSLMRFFFPARTPLLAIQTATRTRRPMPTIQPEQALGHRPAAARGRRRRMPVWFCSAVDVADDVALLLRRQRRRRRRPASTAAR